MLYLMIIHKAGKNAKAVKLGPLSMKELRKAKKRHKAEPHKVSCVMTVQRS